jgi:hypothetical protein
LQIGLSVRQFFSFAEHNLTFALFQLPFGNCVARVAESPRFQSKRNVLTPSAAATRVAGEQEESAGPCPAAVNLCYNFFSGFRGHSTRATADPVIPRRSPRRPTRSDARTPVESIGLQKPENLLCCEVIQKQQIPLPPRRSKLWSAVRMRDRNDGGGTARRRVDSALCPKLEW